MLPSVNYFYKKIIKLVLGDNSQQQQSLLIIKIPAICTLPNAAHASSF